MNNTTEQTTASGAQSGQSNAKLQSFIGHTVRLSNAAKDDMDDSRVQIAQVGKLEYDAEEGTYYVRGVDSYEGLSGIGFMSKHVSEASVAPSGTREIVLH